MTEPIEITTSSAKRVSTGSAFSMNYVPPEFSANECWYEHPQSNLKVGFHGKWIYQRKVVSSGDKIVERSVGLGMILIKDEMGTLVARSLEKMGTKADTQALLLDCYELIVAFLRDQNERGSFLDQPHIYVTSAQEYGKFGDSAQVAPEALKEVRAIEVY